MKKKKMELSKKLIFNKESIMSLSVEQQNLINGAKGNNHPSLDCPPSDERVPSIQGNTGYCWDPTIV